mmetsp:Transcript_23883/g.80169  ORF Transcript_23883/g.80169 Transcript_23883/m.80169 type:complete len:248 (-) Transcript_23883:51-794(-)
MQGPARMRARRRARCGGTPCTKARAHAPHEPHVLCARHSAFAEEEEADDGHRGRDGRAADERLLGHDGRHRGDELRLRRRAPRSLVEVPALQRVRAEALGVHERELLPHRVDDDERGNAAPAVFVAVLFVLDARPDAMAALELRAQVAPERDLESVERLAGPRLGERVVVCAHEDELHRLARGLCLLAEGSQAGLEGDALPAPRGREVERHPLARELLPGVARRGTIREEELADDCGHGHQLWRAGR